MTDSRSQPSSEPGRHHDIIRIGLRAVALRDPDTGICTSAVRRDPPGQPISGLPKPLDRGHWGDQ